ncbi:methyl-accepting chemotaxis protein [Halanaerocella petrolearia]
MLKSIKGKMSLIISLVIFLLISSSTWLIYNQAQNILQQTILTEAKNNAQQNAKIIDIWLQEKRKEIKNLSYIRDIQSMDWNKQLPTLKKIANKDKDIESLFIVDPKGNMRDTSNVSANVAHQNYFQEVKKNKEQIVSKTLKSFKTGKPIVIIANPIYNNNKFVGVAGGVITLNILQDLVKDMKINNSGYGWIINQHLTTIAHPNNKYLGNKEIFKDGNNQLKEIANKMLNKESATTSYQLQGEKKRVAFASIKETGWAIGMTIKDKDMLSPLSVIRQSTLITSLLAIILGIAVAYFIALKITKPILAASNFANKIATGNLKVEELEVDTQDEVGHLMQSLNKMHNSLRQIITNLLESAEDLSAYSEELSASAQEGNATIENTDNLIKSISASIQQISANTQQVNNFAQKTTSKTETGSQNIKETISSMKEINQAVANTTQVINNLSNTSHEIEEIINLIGDIAEQTNLLALNASIEAARANNTKNSTSGQGFTVVAEEIRQLATETNQATNNIADLIAETQEKSNIALDSIQNVKTKVEQGESITQKAGAIFTEIEEASEKTTTQIQQTASATETLAQDSSQVTNATEEIKNMSNEITNSSQELATMAQKIQRLVDEFEI